MLHGWCHVKCCRFGASSVYTIQSCTRLQCHFIQSHMGRVYVCLAVTCHLHFWQNDQDLLRATAVTRGWNGYRNKRQHRKLTLEKKILPPLLPGLEPGTFRSRVRRSNHWASYPRSPQPLKFPGWKVHTWTPSNSIFDGPITNLLSIIDRNPFGCSCEGAKKR